MSQTSALLGLPYLDAAQAQKHVTHNEALRLLDAIVQLAVIDRDLAAPPLTPQEGDRYIVAAGASGAWAGRAGQVAAWQDGAWAFFTPAEGWLAWVADEGGLLVSVSGGWVAAGGGGGGGGGESLPRFGVNTIADAVNRLAVKSDAVLLSHDDVTPGSGDMRAVIDKADVANTASFLFQTDSSGRAEFGLTGDDDWHVKVSDDGANWTEALIADRESGRIAFPQGLEHAPTKLPVAQILPCPTVSDIWRIDSARPAMPRTMTISSVSGTLLNLTGNGWYCFRESMAGNSMVRVWNTSKSPARAAWVVGINSSSQVIVSNASDIAGWTNGETLQIGDPNPTGQNTLQMAAIDISPYMLAKFGAVFPQKGVILSCYSSAAGGKGSIAGSGTGAGGEAFSVQADSTGSPCSAPMILFTPVPSPVSNSNLVYLSEGLTTGSAMGICFARLQGVYV